MLVPDKETAGETHHSREIEIYRNGPKGNEASRATMVQGPPGTRHEPASDPTQYHHYLLQPSGGTVLRSGTVRFWVKSVPQLPGPHHDVEP